MKAPAFEYRRVTSLDELLDELSGHGDEASIIAGGQSLVPAMNMRLAAPALLIDINPIAELSGISVADGRLRIGALTRHWELGRDENVATHAPLLTEAVPHIAHEAIRSRGTFGGSIAIADPAGELPACTLALNADFHLVSRAGTRIVAAADFFTGPYETVIRPGEVLVAAEMPVIQPGYRSGFEELVRRHGDYALVGLAAHGCFDHGVVDDLSLAYCGVSDRAVLATGTAKALNGRPITRDSLATALDALDDELEPLPDLYSSATTKRHLAKVQTRRLLTRLAKLEAGHS